MEYIDGIQIDKLDELKAAGYDIKDIGVNLDKLCQQIIEDGYFHADPHPGRYLDQRWKNNLA